MAGPTSKGGLGDKLGKEPSPAVDSTQSMDAFLADVAKPLQEAEDYERFQLARRRGLVVLAFALVLSGLTALGLDFILAGAVWPFPFAIALMLGGIATAGILRRKPAWRHVFLSYGDGLRFGWPWRIVYAVLFVALLVWEPWERFAGPDALLFILAPLVAFGPGYRGKDWALFHLGWFAVAADLLLAFVPDLLPYTRVLLPGVLVLPLFILAAVRLLAPRRWLAR